MPDANIFGLSARELVERGATWEEINAWVGHHSDGNWFTSRLFHLWQSSDWTNRSNLRRGFENECRVFEAWYGNENLP